MTGTWSIRELLHDLAAGGSRPTIVSYVPDSAAVWDAAMLAGHAAALAARLRRNGIAAGTRVALWAPNSPQWIACALAVLGCGAVLVPIDDLADLAQLAAALAASKPRLVATTASRRDGAGALLHQHRCDVMLIDAADYFADGGEIAPGPGAAIEDWPAPADDAPAILSWTSGTTGAPKGFLLTHRNIAVNVAALRDLAIVGRDDRALLPLPLHHAYPFIVGMLTPLALGTAIVLPRAASGPALTQAMRDARVTVIIGVPRLYEALLTAVEAQVAARGWAARLAWAGALQAAMAARRATGLPAGRLLFAPVRRRVAPAVRLLVSGGARLQRDIEERLEALGWTVLSGYGLAETASLFAGNRPDEHRLGSAGRPLAGGRIRIAGPDAQGIGEIELQGPSITAGYLDNPDADRAAFTADGWFRTGDLGFVDRDGFLFVTGRAKEVLVLGGGKKVDPEELERIYGAAPEIVELAVLEDQGGLVALVRPDAARLRASGVTNLRDGIRVLLGEAAQALPSYQRLSGFGLTDQPLPRTRLGKYRRFLLPDLYARAAGIAARRAPHPSRPEDAALLRDPAAAAVWSVLQQRYPGAAVDLDIDLALDLGLDSFGWMELTVLLQERSGISLAESDIPELRTIRDLLRRVMQLAAGVRGPAPAIVPDGERRLVPSGVVLSAAGAALYALNRMIMRSCFRLRAIGLDRLPSSGPFVIAPSHASYLDPPAIAAALPGRRLPQVHWAGDAQLLFGNPVVRIASRALRVFPVDPGHPAAALQSASRVLRAGGIAVWFPEGWRSPDGSVQRFLPGIGELLLQSRTAVVPARIFGAFEAWPRTRRAPRCGAISVVFGPAALPDELLALGIGPSDEERIANGLRQRVAALADPHSQQPTDIRRRHTRCTKAS